MKFKILRSKFSDGLKAVQNIVSGKGSSPILQNVLLEANGKVLTMTTTDLDISIMHTCECETIETGLTTMPVKILSSAIDKLVEGDVEVDVDANDRSTIIAGNAKFKISGLSEKNFPRLPVDDVSFIYKVPQATLKDMFRKVFYAASQDDTRRTLKGVFMSFKDSKLTMVATDGRRLAIVEQEIEFPQGFNCDIVLPSKTVTELQRSLNGEEEVEIRLKKSQVCFKTSMTTIYSKLVEETYPNYNQVIPKETREQIFIDRQLLLDALERVSVMTIDESHSIKLIFTNGLLRVTSASTDVGEAKDEVPIKYAGENIEIIFNPNYVMDCLRAIDDDEISFNLNDGHSPGVIRCSIPFLYVLMPLRIS